jgi:hypothetical protein
MQKLSAGRARRRRAGDAPMNQPNTELASSRRVSALNPLGYPPTIEQLGMAPRPESLDGRTVYLVDVHFVDGDKLLQQMQAWFAEHLPKTTTVLASKAGVYTEDDPKLFEEIKERGAAVVMAVGH